MFSSIFNIFFTVNYIACEHDNKLDINNDCVIYIIVHTCRS